MAEIDLTWHSTPQLWVAVREGQCGCEDCAGKFPFGMGKTKEAAVKALRDSEADACDATGVEPR
jgi:hypothetical protein